MVWFGQLPWSLWTRHARFEVATGCTASRRSCRASPWFIWCRIVAGTPRPGFGKQVGRGVSVNDHGSDGVKWCRVLSGALLTEGEDRRR